MSAASPAEVAGPLSRIAEIGGLLEASAAAGDAQRRLAPAAVAALHEAGLYRLLLPRDYRGFEVAPPDFFRAIEAVARHDASTAWCLCQAGGCAMTAAYLEPPVAQRIWGDDPQGVLAWGPGKAQAVVEGDGYRLTGNWAFASGGRHASWLGGVATVVEADGRPRPGADGKPEVRTLLFPAGQATWTPIWDVLGLRGTGSDAYAVTDLFVRHDHSVARDDPAERRYEAALYHYPAMCLFASGFAGVALGIAQSFLASFVDLAMEKIPRLAPGRLKDNALAQYEVGECEARLGAARAFLLQEIEAVWRAVQAERRLQVEQRVRIRLAATYAIHQAKGVVDSLYDAAGASAIFASSPFERRYRDIHTVSQQLQGRKTHFQTVGAYRLGHPADLSVL